MVSHRTSRDNFNSGRISLFNAYAMILKSILFRGNNELGSESEEPVHINGGALSEESAIKLMEKFSEYPNLSIQMKNSNHIDVAICWLFLLRYRKDIFSSTIVFLSARVLNEKSHLFAFM